MKGAEMKQTIRIEYNGKPDTELDSRIAGVLEFPPLNFKHLDQGYDCGTGTRDLFFEREDTPQ